MFTGLVSCRNAPNWCAMEVEKNGRLVYSNNIEDIDYGDRLTINPDEDFPDVPRTTSYFY